VEPTAVVDLVDEAWKVFGDVADGLVGHWVNRFDLQRCRPPARHYETANSERQGGGVLPRIRSNPCLIAANLASM
jgi:hypothetical protein